MSIKQLQVQVLLKLTGSFIKANSRSQKVMELTLHCAEVNFSINTEAI